MRPNRSELPWRWVYFFFFCSGATGLIYQVLWTRRLTLTFGHSVLAVSTVLTAFMGGLAIGSLMAGQWVDRQDRTRPPAYFLRFYGLLEGFVGGWAFVSLPLLNLVDRGYVYLSTQGLQGLALHTACFAASVLVIVPPTAAMGATVPLLARMMVGGSSQVGAKLSKLYGLNTLGALAGAALGGFFLLPMLGLNFAMTVAASVNLLIAWGARWVAKEVVTRSRVDLVPAARGKKQRQRKSEFQGSRLADPESGGSAGYRLVVLTFGISGFASMAYQVGWNRALCLSIGSSVYSFSAILVAFLGGIALGSLLYSRLMAGRRPRPELLGWLYLIIGALGALTVPAMGWLPGAYLHLTPWVGQSFGKALFCQAGLVAAVLIPPTLAMGLGFPLATAVYTQSLDHLGGSVGKVYGVNTLGCILGSFATGFFAVPQLGTESTLKLASLAYLLSALAMLVVSATGRSRVIGVLGCVLWFAGTWALPKWDSAVMSSGVVVYATKYLGEEGKVFSLPVFYRDGLSSTVSFHLSGEFWELPNMRVNGKVDASLGEGDRLTQYMLGYLPVLLHPSPKSAAIIGLGGGFTVEAVAHQKSLSRIHVAELEPAVLEAGRYWEPYNGRVLKDPRVKVVLQDGRSFVSGSSHRYDVIISEPSNPWIAGIGNLFTHDFYRKSREKLNPGGLMCQWFNLYHVSQADTALVIRTFFSVFPKGSLWQSSGGDLILIGSSSDLPFSEDRVRRFWNSSPAIQRNFFRAKLFSPDYFSGHYLMSREEALRRVGTGPLNTDDRPILEFSAPLSLYQHGFEDSQQMLWSGLTPSLPPGAKSSAAARTGLFFGVANREDFRTLRQLLDKAEEGTPEVIALAGGLELSDSEGRREMVSKLYEGSRKKFPDNPLISLYWGDLEYGEGRFEKAAELYLTALSNPLPGSEDYLCLRLGQCLLAINDPSRAIRPLLRAADLVPCDSLSLGLVGKALVELRRDREGIDFLKVALQRNPHDPLAYEYLGYAYFNSGKLKEARQTLERLLTLVPNYDVGWLKLALCLKHLKEPDQARKAYQRALELEPAHATLRKDFSSE